MSTSLSDTSKVKRRAPSRPTARIARTPSASEIARNAKHFETWSSHQGCEQVSYMDIPQDLVRDVSDVFNVKDRIPINWLDETDQQSYWPPKFYEFLKSAHQSYPCMFGDQPMNQAALSQLYSEVLVVFNAWTRLRKMKMSKEKFSEADYAGHVYNPIRVQGVADNHARFQCSISLPQPSGRSNLVPEAVRILNAKSVIPDFSVFVPARRVRDLSNSAKSPFNTLKRHVQVNKCGEASRGSSFRYQATPCAQLPETPGFEFISSVFEDKKPTHLMLDDAYRQNRMATAAVVRHLHSLCIDVPVFGLVWATGTVRAHVDWCQQEEGKQLAVFSAPYPSSADQVDEEDLSLNHDIFHDWELEKEGDILQVYFIVKNIDTWTSKKFRQRVISGVQTLMTGVSSGKKQYKPWKRVGELSVLAPKAKENNVSTSISASSISTPPKQKPRSKRRR
ncbi:hypothetical protein EYR40_003846 [Pleurotus pulmonarius]|nr:hypothetical protein EYR40_003846 [Pleurotus pulmonarius]KAF4606555.1 hypothetical protein EYR38_000609 [Pleurotus pulmonarius]